MFIDLAQALDKVDGISRYRISSIEPNLCTDEVIEFVSKSKNFLPHFHIPLQSGSDKMLKLMRRRYNTDLYVRRVESIKKFMPHCCIGVDVIVGFPGETEEDFMDTYDFINNLDISYLHVFTYSERANTLAAEMQNPVPMNVRRERNEMLRILSQKKKRAFYQSHLSSVRNVLVEKDKKSNSYTGFTDNYIKVNITSEQAIENSIIPVSLEKIAENGNVNAKVVSLVF